jgi:glycosyltransferase involved in cell wall biosynthesis
MKKIVVIHNWGAIGGSGISLYYTCQSLQKKYELIVYIPEIPSALDRFLKLKGIQTKTYPFQIAQIPYYSGGSSITKPGFWYFILQISMQRSYWKAVLLKEKPDLVVVNSKVLCWMADIIPNISSLCFVRETIPGNPKNLINAWMKSKLEKFSIVAFLSKYDLEQTNLTQARSIVSPDFLQLKDYENIYSRKTACQKLGIRPDCFNVLFVGGVDQLKGIDLAVIAMNYLKDENIRLIVAGKDIGYISDYGIKKALSSMIRRKHIKYSDKIRKFIVDSKIHHKISFIGVQEDISIAYSAADVLIFPMKKPHQARPVFEIGIQKKPIIVTDFPNIREYIQDEVNGLLFEPDNAHDLARAILRLKNDHTLYQRLGEMNYNYAIEYHSEEKAMDELIKVIEHNLSGEKSIRQ